MRIKITLEMSGNEFLNLLRRVPKTVAQQLFDGSTVLPPAPPWTEIELFTKSAQDLVEAKKR